MKRLIQILLTMLLAFGASIEISADPPNKLDCNDTSKYPDVYSRLECRQQGIANQLVHTSDFVFADGTPLHGRIKPARLAHIKNGANKAERAALKNDRKMFKKLAKGESKGNKSQELGHLVPFNDDADDGDNGAIAGDGICDYEQRDLEAKCAAIEVGQDGALMECNPNKKNKGKGKPGGNDKFSGLECDRFVEDDDENDMEAVALNMEDTYSATEANLYDMNLHLETVNEVLAEPAALLNMETEGGCNIPETNTDLANAVIALREIHATLEGASAVAHNGCEQVAVALGFGGNGSVVCTCFDAAALVANIAYIGVDEAQKSESGEVQAAIMECSAKTADAVAELLAEVAALKVLMQQEHAAIMFNDDEHFTETIRVLNTPHGQRDQHPNP